MTILEDSQRPLLIEMPITIRTYDIDFANIVHNMVYVRWLEDLRLELLANTYPIDRMLAEKWGPILTKTNIEYKLSITIHDKPIGRMWVQDLRRVRWTVAAEIYVGPRIAMTAVQQGFFASMETLRPIRVPKTLVTQWQKALAR